MAFKLYWMSFDLLHIATYIFLYDVFLDIFFFILFCSFCQGLQLWQFVASIFFSFSHSTLWWKDFLFFFAGTRDEWVSEEEVDNWRGKLSHVRLMQNQNVQFYILKNVFFIIGTRCMYMCVFDCMKWADWRCITIGNIYSCINVVSFNTILFVAFL